MLRTRPLPGFLLVCSALGLQAQDTINVACDGGAVGGTYCYPNNDDHTWLWQSECGAGILLQFISGTLEAAPYDHLSIHDGPNELAPVLFMNPSTPATTDLAGLQLVSTTGTLFMKMTSNATNCCATNGLLPMDGTWSWHWTAGTAIVGVGTVAPGDFRIWPNPAADVLTMQLPAAASGPVDIRIVDALGRVVLRKQHAAGGEQTTTLNLHGLVVGGYSVELRSPHWCRTTRLQIAP